MMRSSRRITVTVRIALCLAVVCVLLLPVVAMAQPRPMDVITVGSGTAASGTTVDIPVYIRDVSGTALGIDQPAGSRIQAFSLKVDYAPAGDVPSVTFNRGGITASLTPANEIRPSSPGSTSLLDSFDENTNLIPFTSNAAVPGNEVAHLTFQLASGLTPGTQITLTLDPALTQLTDQGGDAATKESVGGGNLALVAGVITIANRVPSLSTAGLLLLVLLLGLVGVRFAARSL